uniref:hypothetical protein n=1 Tax=Actinomadura kijaniata TaxID=46161 RepID=UPI000ABF61CB
AGGLLALAAPAVPAHAAAACNTGSVCAYKYVGGSQVWRRTWAHHADELPGCSSNRQVLSSNINMVRNRTNRNITVGIVKVGVNQIVNTFDAAYFHRICLSDF